MIYFWVSYFRSWFLWPETKKPVIPFCVSILFLDFYPCIVYPHIGDLTNLAGYPPLNQISSFVITSLTITYRWEWITNSRKIARWCQDWRFQVSFQRKSIPGTYPLTVYIRVKVQVDLQADKSSVVFKEPFFPRVVNPRYRIRGTNVWCKSWSIKADELRSSRGETYASNLKNITRTNLIY
jgi:hypothetical protein